jgi:methylmalonyl-CoA mutase N-terminal domain/subunit
MTNAIETVKEMIGRGYDVDWVAERLAFFWDISNDFFEEIARIRAARRLWYRIMKYRFGFGGVQSLHVDSYDESYSVPTEAASLVSLRTQQIIQEETAMTHVVDPLGGSFYVESLTNEIEGRVLDEITEIEEMGGIVAAVANGWLHKKIAEYARYENEMIEQGEIKIVGRNYAKATGIYTPEIDVFRYPKDVAERQRQKLEKLRLERDNERVEDCLQALQEACNRHGENIVPYCIEAVRANATEGELANVFRKAFGLWKPPAYW